jgi:deazaflavin-dependent oxidoreductase (nitroreductase family)
MHEMLENSHTAPYIRTGFVAKHLIGPLLGRLGFVPTLIVPGRLTGKAQVVPVVPFEVDGARYLVAPQGLTQWARNLRAAGRAQLRRRGGVEEFSAVEVAGAERERVVVARRQNAPRPVRKLFERIADPADHPTFRIEARRHDATEPIAT